MDKDEIGKKRKNLDALEDLGKIKKSKNKNSSSGIINMGKVPANKDKISVIELDINELSDILSSNKRVLRSRTTTINKKKNESDKESKKPKVEEKKEVVDSKKIDKDEKKKMIKKYGGYFDENDEFIIDDDSVNEDKMELDYSSDEGINIKPQKTKKQSNKVTTKMLKEMDLTNDDYNLMTEDEFKYWKKISREERQNIKKLEKELEKYEINDIPERYRILQFPVNLAVKRNIMNKLTQIEMMEPSDPEYFKLSKWLDGVMKIPFGTYLELPISKNDNQNKIQQFIEKVSEDMENSTYGHKEAKNKIIQVVCQWISNPKSTGNILAIQGPPGIGKTSLVRNGISKALGRPFHMIALGGATDSTFLEGHSYTYEGSSWGRIASILMDSKVMNPVIFFDELDKVSGTKQGEEIIGVLTHLTDQTQNCAFNDKYFSGIELDMSKCLFVFSYNDESLINPILRDRLTKINLKGFGLDDKVLIARNYLLKELSENIGIGENEFSISDEILRDIIQKHTHEDGVRDLRRCLETILLKLNMAKYTNKLDKSLEKISFPVKLDSLLVDELLKKVDDDKNFHKTHMMYI